MQQFQSSGGPETGLEKILRWAIPLGIFALIFYFWGQVSAFVVATLENTLKAGIYGFILFVILMYVVPNWKHIVRKITSGLIKMDPLSFMDRYADILSEKLANVQKSIVNLAGEEVTLSRQIEADTKIYEKQLALGAAAKKQQNLAQASLAGSRAKGAMDSIKLYTPNLERTQKSLKFLRALAENWDISITTLRETIERKRTEFRILKKNAETLKQSEEFLRGDTEEGRIYQESIKQLELQVGQKIAYIEDFEKRAKPLMEGAAIEKQMNEDEGMKMIDDYLNDSNLFLPNFTVQDLSADQYQITPVEFNTNNKPKFTFKSRKSGETF